MVHPSKSSHLCRKLKESYVCVQSIEFQSQCGGQKERVFKNAACKYIVKDLKAKIR